MIKVVNVSKFYGARKALDNVSFPIAEKETVGILGLDGSGKSTLAKIIAGYLAPTNGHVAIGGEDPRIAQVRLKIGYLPQFAPLPPAMRVREYLRFRAGLKGVGGKLECDKAIKAVNDFCPVTHLLTKLAGRLTKNERQWVGIADALLARPEILVLDDLTGEMDARQSALARDMVAELCGRVTIVLTCRVPADIERLCGRVVVLDGGRVVEDGNLADIYRGSVEERTVVLTVAAHEPVREAFRAVPGVRTVIVSNNHENKGEATVRISMPSGVDLRQELSDLCARRGWLITEMRREAVTLEDILGKVR